MIAAAVRGRSSRLALTATRSFVPRTSAAGNARRSLSSPVTPEEEPPVIDDAMKMKNAALGLTLTAFVFGVGYYSMWAVGQATRGDDPLAALHEEAEEARAAQADELTEAENAAAILEKFQKGEYDPDEQLILEAEEAEMAAEKKRKPWWKVW